MLMGLSKYSCLKTMPAALALDSMFTSLFPFTPTAGGIKYRFLVRTGRNSGTGCHTSRDASAFWEKDDTQMFYNMRRFQNEFVLLLLWLVLLPPLLVVVKSDVSIYFNTLTLYWYHLFKQCSIHIYNIESREAVKKLIYNQILKPVLQSYSHHIMSTLNHYLKTTTLY